MSRTYQFFVPEPPEEVARKAQAALDRLGRIQPSNSHSSVEAVLPFTLGWGRPVVRAFWHPTHGEKGPANSGTMVFVEARGYSERHSARALLEQFHIAYQDPNDPSLPSRRRRLLWPVLLVFGLLAIALVGFVVLALGKRGIGNLLGV